MASKMSDSSKVIGDAQIDELYHQMNQRPEPFTDSDRLFIVSEKGRVLSEMDKVFLDMKTFRTSIDVLVFNGWI